MEERTQSVSKGVRVGDKDRYIEMTEPVTAAL